MIPETETIVVSEAVVRELIEALNDARHQINGWNHTAKAASGALMPRIMPSEAVIDRIERALRLARGRS